MDGPGPRLISLSFEGMQPIACFGGGRPRIYLIRTPVKDYHASRSVLGTPMLEMCKGLTAAASRDRRSSFPDHGLKPLNSISA